MAEYDINPPFPRGSTAFGAGFSPANTDADQLCGRVVTFEDRNWADRYGALRSNHLVHCLIVRNTSGGPLLPKFLAQIDANYDVAGYTATAGGEGFPIDEFLPAGGVANNDLFYVVIGGPAKCLLDIAATNGNLVAARDWITALTAAASTAATSGATSNNITAGRVQMEAGTVAALLATATSGNTDISTIIKLQRNVIGWAVSAATTNSTGLAATGSPLVFVTQSWKFCH